MGWYGGATFVTITNPRKGWLSSYNGMAGKVLYIRKRHTF